MDDEKRTQEPPAEPSRSDEVETKELGEDELADAAGGDPGYLHPAPYSGHINGH